MEQSLAVSIKALTVGYTLFWLSVQQSGYPLIVHETH